MSGPRLVLLAAAGLCLAAGWSARAAAEGGRDEVSIEAERVELDRNAGLARFEGGVRVRHGELELRCARLTAEVADDGRVVALVATGEVRLVVGPGVTATAERARYEPASGRITLAGRPRVRAPEGELTGRSVVIHAREGRVSVEGARGVFGVR